MPSPFPTIPILAFFDIGGTEMMLIALVALVLFGGEKMPEFARGLGKAIRDFKKAASGVEDEIKRAMEEPQPKSAPLPEYPVKLEPYVPDGSHDNLPIEPLALAAPTAEHVPLPAANLETKPELTSSASSETPPAATEPTPLHSLTPTPTETPATPPPTPPPTDTASGHGA